jgi:hypothetical protein
VNHGEGVFLRSSLSFSFSRSALKWDKENDKEERRKITDKENESGSTDSKQSQAANIPKCLSSLDSLFLRSSTAVLRLLFVGQGPEKSPRGFRGLDVSRGW